MRDGTSLLTIAERSGFRATSTHAEVMAYLDGLTALGRGRLHVDTFGKSPEGRALPLLVLSSEGVRAPAAARASDKPVVLLQCCIHAGEVEGKEAALMLARDLLGGLDDGLLDAMTLVIVPIFNPDGNDAMDPSNRALQIERLKGQNGPPRAGTRNNAAGINLNRDYMRHDGLEMRLLQRNVCQRWLPELTVDTHATNGSVHRFAMTYDVPHTVESGRREPIDFMRHVLVPEISAAVRRNAGFDSGWYGNFVEDERVLDRGGIADPSVSAALGWMTYPHHPRFGSNYRGLGGRLDLLLECYSYLGFEERVRTTYAWLLETLRAVSRRATEVRALVEASATPPSRIAIRYRVEPMAERIDILTYRPRTLEGEPASVRVPFIARFVGETVTERPDGYFVPGRLAEFFQGHGFHVETAPRSAEVEAATFEAVEHMPGRAILEAAGVGHRRVSWTKSSRSLPQDTVFVPATGALGALAVYLCEPESDDGLVENGFVPTPALGSEFEVLRCIGR